MEGFEVAEAVVRAHRPLVRLAVEAAADSPAGAALASAAKVGRVAPRALWALAHVVAVVVRAFEEAVVEALTAVVAEAAVVALTALQREGTPQLPTPRSTFVMMTMTKKKRLPPLTTPLHKSLRRPMPRGPRKLQSPA